MKKNRVFFTLLEVMIGAGIAGMMMVVIYGAFTMWGKESNRQFKRLEYGKEFRNYLPLIVRDIRYARDIIELKDDILSLKVPVEGNTLFYKPELKTVTYEVKKRSSDKYLITRYDEKEGESTLFSFLDLNENVFTGYVENSEKKFFSKFDSFKDGSKKRDRVVMIKVSLIGKVGAEGNRNSFDTSLVSRVCMDFRLQKLKERYWNFRQ